MSGQSLPSTPSPRRSLPWQQRRPVSSTNRHSTSSPSGLSQSPPQQISIQSPEQTVSQQPPRNSRLSVSSLSQTFSAQSPPITHTPPAPLPFLRHNRSNSTVKAIVGTFAPQFIKDTDERQNSLPASGKGIAGENSDFSGRRWVWVRDPEKAFVKGEVLKDDDGMLTVRCDDGSVWT
jgi:myosin protein heavy chain